MAEPLSYQTPENKKRRSPLQRALWISAVEHIGIFGLATLILDGGEFAGIALAVSAAYWVLALLIVFRRWKPPSTMELTYLAFGFPIMLAICIAIRTIRS